MVQARRRVSYIIPPPSEPPPRLQLPPYGISRLGATGPLLTPYKGGHSESSSALSIMGSTTTEEEFDGNSRHPRHRLGVASLALDLSTQLVGRRSPEGILYSGGRDGLIMSWDLGIPMKKKSSKVTTKGRWEYLTGWADDAIEEENEDGEDRPVSDGDVLGEVTTAVERRRAASLASLAPFERGWETDMSAFKPKTPTRFRQASQAHSDWVNDILLCNYNQTVVSASSDGTVKAWNPYASTLTDPSIIGSHTDYVRNLTNCREQNWVASGSFDRTVKIWDLGRPPNSNPEPLVTLHPPDAAAPKASIYALAADPFGRTIASGSPERVIRLWDPRTGKRTGKLVGHTDNIRAILISEDSKYLLTGSADASIKLWSLTTQRCLHTFNHHADSVWSLFSDHPSLEVFYSGDRSGLVCRVDVEDCADISEGECLLICNDSSESLKSASEGINKIVVMDDNLLWTASGTSTIKRWNIPLRQATRIPIQPSSPSIDPDSVSSPYYSTFKRSRHASPTDTPSDTRPSTSHAQDGSRRVSLSPSMHSVTSDQWHDRDQEGRSNGLPYESLIKLVSPNDPFTAYSGLNRPKDADVATLYSAASIMSVPRHQNINNTANRSPPVPFQPSSTSITTPLHSSRTEDTVLVTHNTARAEYEERELAEDAVPFCSDPDDIIPGDYGLVRSIILNDRANALTVNTVGEVAVWDIIRGKCLGRYLPEDVAAASHAGSTTNGIHGAANINDEERERSPREALEAVRERIEGEAAVSSWCMADTKGGVLTIHMTERCFEAEVYADEVGFQGNKMFNEDSKLNIAKWVLRNLFIGFIQEELRLHQLESERTKHNASPNLSRPSSQDTLEENVKSQFSHGGRKHRHNPHRHHQSKPSLSTGTVICSPNMVPAVQPSIASPVRSSPLLAPLIPLYPSRELQNLAQLPPIPQSPAAIGDTPTAGGPTFGQHQRARSGTVDGSITVPGTAVILTPSTGKEDYFTSKVRHQTATPASAGMPPGTSEDPSGWTSPTPGNAKADIPPLPQTPSTPSATGGLIGRLRNFGKSAKRPVSDVVTGTTSAIAGLSTPTAGTPNLSEERSNFAEIAKTPLQKLLSGPLIPPTSTDAPLHHLPPNTTVIISEEAQPSYNTLYRRYTSDLHHDIAALESTMPMWLVEYLLLNQTPPTVPLAKVSFVLMPWNKDQDAEPLPELLNTTQSKLTASRYLRVKKIVNHVQDKLARMSTGSASQAGSIRSSMEDPKPVFRSKAEDEYEILCNDTLLPLGMSLAAVRQYVWKQGAELVLYYRRKKVLLQNQQQQGDVGYHAHGGHMHMYAHSVPPYAAGQ